MSSFPIYHSGAGLRNSHIWEILASRPPFRWFEIITENFMELGGSVKEAFCELSKLYRIIPHGVCLSIGSTDPLDWSYLKRVRDFCNILDAPWYSDHLCFTMVDHVNLNELIPLPHTIECAKHVAERARQVQDFLERPLLLENVTRYITIDDELTESEFVNQVLELSGCGLLLDVTNVRLNSTFHNYDPYEFIASMPMERVGQVHLAGWSGVGDDIIDSHDAPVPPEVWELFKFFIQLKGETSVLIEWDEELPSVDRLLKETQMADRLMSEVLGKDESISAAICNS